MLLVMTILLDQGRMDQFRGDLIQRSIDPVFFIVGERDSQQLLVTIKDLARKLNSFQ